MVGKTRKAAKRKTSEPTEETTATADVPASSPPSAKRQKSVKEVASPKASEVIPAKAPPKKAAKKAVPPKKTKTAGCAAKKTIAKPAKKAPARKVASPEKATAEPEAAETDVEEKPDKKVASKKESPKKQPPVEETAVKSPKSPAKEKVAKKGAPKGSPSKGKPSAEAADNSETASAKAEAAEETEPPKKTVRKASAPKKGPAKPKPQKKTVAKAAAPKVTAAKGKSSQKAKEDVFDFEPEAPEEPSKDASADLSEAPDSEAAKVSVTTRTTRAAASKGPAAKGKPTRKVGFKADSAEETSTDASADLPDLSETEAVKAPDTKKTAARGRQAKKTAAKTEAVNGAADVAESSKATVHENANQSAMKANGLLKILSWNVAGLRSVVKKKGQKIFEDRGANIVALQEIKCAEIPEEIEELEFEKHIEAGEKSGHAGVMLLSKQSPINVTCGFQAKGVDGKGHLIVAEYDKFYLINAYVPNSGRELRNLEERKVWDQGFLDAIKELDAKKPVIYTGDLNVAHEEIDLANPKTNRNKNAGFTDDEREGFSRLLEAGFVDVYRHMNPGKEGAYTFWSNMRNSRAKNVGWRLDYFVVSHRILDKVVGCEILSEVTGSDHCPIELHLAL